MISTIESKDQQLRNGYFQSGSGPTEILLIGSCRTLAYTNYLIRWNDSGGNNQFTIRRIDACDWAVSGVNIDSLETDERILAVLRSTNIFIHEFLENYGFCNTSLECRKNVYQNGMNPTIDISIPNFHDRFALLNDWLDCGIATPSDYIEKGEEAMEQFCQLCKRTSFPEFGDYFRQNWRSIRLFWRPNHTSGAFTIKLFELMNTKFLGLPLSEEFWAGASGEDQFKHPHTHVVESDISGYGLKWS